VCRVRHRRTHALLTLVDELAGAVVDPDVERSAASGVGDQVEVAVVLDIEGVDLAEGGHTVDRRGLGRRYVPEEAVAVILQYVERIGEVRHSDAEIQITVSVNVQHLDSVNVFETYRMRRALSGLVSEGSVSVVDQDPRRAQL